MNLDDFVMHRVEHGALDHLFAKYGSRESKSAGHIRWGPVHVSKVITLSLDDYLYLHLGSVQKRLWFRNYHRIAISTLLRLWDVEVAVTDIEYGTPTENVVRLCGEEVFQYSLNTRHFEALRRSGVERIRLISADPFLTEADHMAFLGEWM